MKKINKIESFVSFRLSDQSMNKISGARSKDFMETSGGDCAKVLDTNDGRITKIKVKERYSDFC